MKVIIHGVHLSLSDELKGYVEKRLARPMERFADDPAAELTVMLKDSNGSKGGVDKECSVTFSMPGSAALHVTEIDAEIHQAIDLAEGRLVTAAKREMEKKRTVTGHPGAKPAAILAEEAAGELPK